MAEEVQDNEVIHKDVKVEEAPNVESQIQEAMHSRVSYFKEQSDSLTFEGVRRLLEKDLGLETYALDMQKRFIKQCLLKCLDEVDDEDTSKNSGDAGQKSVTREAPTCSPEGHQSKNDIKGSCTEDEEKMEDSPVLGLLNGTKPVKTETEEAKGNGNNKVPSESTIKKAISKRASYIKANSVKVTTAGVRRLIEEDLKLDEYTLDPFKKLISQQLEEVLKSSSNAKKIVKKTSDSKSATKASSDECSDSSDQGTDEEDEDKVKPRKRSIAKGKVKDIDGPQKRKRPAEDTSLSSKKQSKPATETTEDNSDGEDGENNSEDDLTQSSSEKPTKKKEVSTPAYGKHVEHLKSVIKACGVSVPPAIYKKVKQVPENKREAHLIKELQEILSREGLSSNPAEKEIKDVRRKKERARELEGIDMSNIVSSSRRRSTRSFVAPPPKAKIPVQADGDDAEDTDVDNNEEEEEEGEEDEEEEEDDEEEEEEASQSEEEFNEDEDSD
ncbi:DNA ligase 1-like isoform X1 [Quillaja saponaria]|uniref:DNA ligase 1-like isoform X1 n=1 Tax=Quillaja saponaria TaxID=32244 RepID=A0AAD7LJ54_QUISA|nr:DNA ligase 1-like isoform X1 [Quillaja saponaria]